MVSFFHANRNPLAVDHNPSVTSKMSLQRMFGKLFGRDESFSPRMRRPASVRRSGFRSQSLKIHPTTASPVPPIPIPPSPVKSQLLEADPITKVSVTTHPSPINRPLKFNVEVEDVSLEVTVVIDDGHHRCIHSGKQIKFEITTTQSN